MPLAEIAQRMHERKVGVIVVTNADGQLIGILFRKDADRRREAMRATAPGEVERQREENVCFKPGVWPP